MKLSKKKQTNNKGADQTARMRMLICALIVRKTPNTDFLAYCPFGPQREKTCLREFANNTGADQPAHPRSLISAFVIRIFESSICKLVTGKISMF